MPKDGRAWVLWLAIVSILVVASGFVVFIYLPLNPTITVTFRIATSSGYSITVGPTSYVKASSYGSVGIPQCKILLSRLDTATGPHGLSVVVRYAISTLSVQSFTMIGDGGIR